jgi:hypothetical protein
MIAKTISEKFETFTSDRSCDKRWVCVKGKTPVRPGTDSPLEWRDIKNRYSWEQIQMIPGDYGIILDKTGLTCIDFDKCLNETGSVIDDRIYDILRELDTWCEVSSSGRGLHAWIVTDANTPNKKPGTGFEVISDGHVKVSGNSFAPYASNPIRMIDGEQLIKILRLNGSGTLESNDPKVQTPGKPITREKIHEGNRNTTLFKLAASLRQKGLSSTAIHAAIREENLQLCSPPLPDVEVSRIATSAGSYAPGELPLISEEVKTAVQPPVVYDIDIETITGEEIKTLMLKGFRVNAADIGADDAALIELLAFMGGRELTGDGIHQKVSGGPGAGKSVIINAGQACLPQAILYAGAFTPKALVYDKTLKPGIIVKVDESQELTPEFLSIMKESISSFQTPIKYRTVLDKKDGTITITIPERITWVIVSVDNIGEEQVLDRLFPLGIDSKDTFQNITDFRLMRRNEGREKLSVNEDVMRIRYALTHYLDKKFRVLVPFAQRITYKDAVKRDQRLQEFFENCIIYHAVLCYRERDHQEKDGLITVCANEADFQAVTKIGIFNRPVQTTNRLLPSEIQFIKDVVANNHHLSQFPIGRSELLKMGYSQSRLSHILNGRDKKGNGLLSKVHGMAETNMTVGGRTDECKSTEIGYRVPADISDLIPENESIESQVQSIAFLKPDDGLRGAK